MARYRIICMTLLFMLLLTGCREKAEKPSLTFSVSGESFTVTNAEGENLRCSGGAFSGGMTVREQQSVDLGLTDSDSQHILEVANSKTLSCQWDEVGSHTFSLLPNHSLGGNSSGSEELYREYSVSGECLETAAITVEGKVDAVTGENGLLEAAFSLPCDALDAHGYVRFSGAAKGSVSVQPDEEHSQFRFSGFLPGGCVLSYAGAQSNPWVSITLDVGSGVIDLSRLTQGQVILQEDGREVQVLTIS